MPQKRQSTDDGALLESAQGDSKKKKVDESLFGEVLSDSGFILNFNNEPYTLDTDQALFQRRLQKSLRAHPVHCYPASVKEFLRGLDGHISDNGRLKWALLYTQTASGCSAASRTGHQDSLLRLLLNIDELQVDVITLLVERLLEVVYSVSSDDDHSLPRLILANLQRLDRLTDPSAVSDRMLELLLGAPPEVQKDIITFLPEVVDDATHPKVAEELCKLYYSSPELSVTILDALPGLSLSPEALLEVKHSVQKTVQAARPEHLPVVVKFLLEDAGRAEELIVDLRRRLRLPPPAEQGRSQPEPGTQADQHSASHEMALLQNIKFAFQVDKRQHMSWLKALDGLTPPDVHHPLDLLLLLQLHDTAPARQRLVEAVLKKKVRSRVFSREVLQQTFTAHAQTLKQFISTLRRLAGFLLRCLEPALSSYGAEMYRLAFVSFSGYQQQEVVIGLLSHSADPPAVRQAALRLFQRLAEQNTDGLARYSSFLKSWLDLLEQLTLPEARQLMEVLSTLAFRAPQEAATVGDELKLLIHKQLASSSSRYKRLGVISVLMAIKCRQNSGDTSGATTVSDDSQSSEIVLTTAGQRETVQLLQMAQSAVSAAPTARGLLLDELGSLVWRAGIDPKIESWLCDQQMDEFQEAFVVDLPEGEPACDGLKVTLQYGLEEAAVGEIALNLAPMVLQSPDQLSTVCAHFRLLRMCVASLDGGTMEKLDALLGCPVIVPAEVEPEAVSALPPAARHAVLTSLFHCANFFRELLNAFSTQKDQEMKRRCVLRLRALLQLEGQIRQLLPLVPGFVPPAAIFDADTPPAPPAAVKKQKAPPKRKGKGKASSKAAANTTANQTAASQLDPATQAEERGETTGSGGGGGPDLTGYRVFFRELDMDVYRLLYRRLSLTDHTSEEFCLRPSELLLLLEDLGLKLERRLAAASGGGLAAMHAASAAGAARGLGFAHLDLLPEASVARQAATLLKPLSVIADSIVTMFKSQIDDNDGVLDGPGMFGEEAGRLAACLAAVYRVTATLLSWPGLADTDNQQLATEAVANLRLTDSGRSQLPPSQQAQHPAVRAFALFEQHAASVPHIECAANLARTLSALAGLSSEQRLREALADCADTLLKREWFTSSGARETGAAYGGRVSALLQLLLAPDGRRLLDRLDRLAQTALSELAESTSREPASETYPTLSKSTFGHYYRVMFAALVGAIRATVAAAGSERSRLDRWATALRIFNQLVGCLRNFSSRSVVGLCLKYSRRLVDLFVRHAIPMLELMLKHQRDEVLTILKNFQLSARYLHHVCNHSKNLKDASLMNHVPYLKKGLESFVFRVKAMLALNGCSDAFWMGNLKNRDLHGEEILSQTTEGGSGDEEEDAEDAAGDAAESDVDLDAEEERSSPDRPAVGDVEGKQESEISDAY